MKDWALEEIPQFLDGLENLANRHGFLISAYGSTMRRGVGRDLDLICVQKRCGVIPKYFLEDLAHRLEAKVEHAEQSLFAELCALLKMPDGKLVDVQIRLSRCGPQDALDMYLAALPATQNEEGEK